MTDFHAIRSVEVEHLVGAVSGLPLVKLRVISDRHRVILVDEMEVAQARNIALDLLRACARAEYEHDFITEARNAGLEDNELGIMLHMIRLGEITNEGGPSGTSEEGTIQEERDEEGGGTEGQAAP